MDKRFLEALIHRKHSILGYALTPFSLAHVVALEAANNPVVEGKGFGFQDALIFCKVCSSKDPLHPELNWGWRDLLFSILDRGNPIFLFKVRAQVSAYLEDYCSPPEFFESRKDDDPYNIFASEGVGGKKLTGPWVGLRLAALMHGGHMAFEEALRMPLGIGAWMEGCLAEIQGAKLTFFDPENPPLSEEEADELKRLAAEPFEPEARPGEARASEEAEFDAYLSGARAIPPGVDRGPISRGKKTPKQKAKSTAQAKKAKEARDAALKRKK